jgi:phage tail-like protein
MPEAAAKAPKTQSPNAPGTFVDPYPGFYFKLIILGITEAHFTQCSGIEIKVDPISYSEGGSSVVHQIPGKPHFEPVTLSYGFTESKDLWKWVMSSVNQPVQRKNVQILILDVDGMTEKARFTLFNAWPSEWSGAALNAMSSEVIINKITFSYEHCELQ